jgi:LPS sulfotransferase NodH
VRPLDPTDRSRAERDFPTRTPTLRRYVLASVPRSGSTLLADLLWSTGLAGAPMEYFSPGPLVDLVGRIDPGGPLERFGRWRRRGLRPPLYLGEPAWDRVRLARYVGALETLRTGPGGVFGFKLHYQQALRAFTRKGFRVEEFFPELRWVYVRRRDRVRQAVSWLRARQTGAWDDTLPGAPGDRYDADAIAERLRLLEAQEAGWESYFAEGGIAPLRLDYEEIAPDPVAAGRGVLRHVGVEGWEHCDVPAPERRRQADGVTEAWVARFREETGAA